MASSHSSAPSDAPARMTLLELVALLTRWLDEPKKSVTGRRLELAHLDDAYASELTQSAQSLREAAEADAARGRATPVTQQELDHDDGLSLAMLTRVVDAFDAAHVRDASIARLIPSTTRRFFRRSPSSNSVTKPAPAPAPTPAPKG